MNIDNRLNDPLFAPAPLTGAQTRQDNEQRERVGPAEPADAFAGHDQRRERDRAEVTLYDVRGQKTGDQAGPQQTEGQKTDDGEQAVGEEQQSERTEQPDAEAASRPAKPSGEPMSEQEVAELQDLKLRDQEVRTHEQQHAAVGGQHTGAPNYEYETGPDGKQYAVEGHVQVDMSPVAGDPQATIEKMQQVKAAALAPAQPSQADKSAAAQADRLMAEAQAELQQQHGTGSQQPATRAESNSQTAASGGATTASGSTEPASPAPNEHTPMQQRNDIIAGVYGRAAEGQARALLGLA
ncbi:putative metalloprotease CJM1_0395 family protein [Oceanimonas pelagia]|uniref:Metalloprotease CJM1_0395 family protein n=1 Tax=Oceanimonas pelagia TaxID=3028314 RepID=A0AA50KNK0_9GAMM|nr:putative metalloprotease CJM1_0395 family protein [Oceanimonas pelagia]WMC10829.1 putative metalloprotease CJM1_0395 family protein [Oceanimonas pelagia]